MNHLSWDIWKNVLTIILSNQDMQPWWSTGFQHQIRIEKRQLTLLNYGLSRQQLFSRSQKQMLAICSPPFIVAFLNQSTFTIRSVLYFHNHVMYLYRLQCNVILGWSASSSLITMTTIMDSWIVIDSPAAWPLSTDKYKLKWKKHVLDDPLLEANQCSVLEAS